MTDDDDEWEEGSLAECDRCHEWRVCILSVDPFISEVYGDEDGELESSWWCLPCYSERKDDV